MLADKIKKLIIYFIPDTYKEDVFSYRKAENIVNGALFGLIFVVLLLTLNMSLGLWVSSVVHIVASLLLIINLYSFKRGLSEVYFGELTNFVSYILIFSISLETGGVFSPAISAFMVSGMIAFLYRGRKSGLFWGAAGIISIAILGILDITNQSFPSKISSTKATIYAVIFNILLLIFLSYLVRSYVAILKNISKRNFLKAEKMERFHQVLSEQEEQIQKKNKELLSLYEQFNTQNQNLFLQKELLQTQNDELTSTYEELIDSIYYTKRIQDALLPDDEVIKKYFAELMILYKPKEILSGDFFWFAQVEKYTFILVADCTGHGIPGAFMTVIGNDLLNRIIKEEHTFSPKNILERLDAELSKTLQQELENTRGIADGMDIAICRIDREAQEICFAGAKRPLWIVKQGKLEEIKGSRVSIGGLGFANKSYEEHIIKASAEDIFYISTDGYTDQFGGEDDTKFLTLRLKEKLQQLYPKPLEYQKLYLLEVHEMWKGFINEQTDDILLIAFRI